MWKLELTTEETLLLDGKVSGEAQAVVDQARFASTLTDLNPEQAKVAGEAYALALARHRLVWRQTSIDFCPICKREGEYPVYKSGYRKGMRKDRSRPRCFAGIEVKDSFIRIRGHVSVGGCLDCMTPVQQVLTKALAQHEVELPKELSAEGRLPYKLYGKCTCTKCGWEGHEGLLGPVSTLFGNGHFPGICPSCFAEQQPLGRDVFTKHATHAIADSRTLPRWERTMGLMRPVSTTED